MLIYNIYTKGNTCRYFSMSNNVNCFYCGPYNTNLELTKCKFKKIPVKF